MKSLSIGITVIRQYRTVLLLSLFSFSILFAEGDTFRIQESTVSLNKKKLTLNDTISLTQVAYDMDRAANTADVTRFDAAPPQPIETSDKVFTQLTLSELMNIQTTIASKKVESIFDAPGIVTTVSSEEIALFGANNLWEILDRIPGIQLSKTEFGNSIQFRGDKLSFDGNHFLILLDGVSFSRDCYAGGFFMEPILNSFPVGSIERIEVIRGPGSVLYGSNAFMGVINIITKKNKKNHMKTELMAGSFTTLGADIFFDFQHRELKLISSVFLFDTHGDEMKSKDMYGETFSADRHETDLLGLNTHAQLRHFYFNSSFVKGERFQWNGTAADHITYWKVDRHLLSFGYLKPLGDHWKIDTKISNNSTRTELPITQISMPTVDYELDDGVLEATVNGSYGNFNIVSGGLVTRLAGKTNTVISDWEYYWWSLYTSMDYMIRSKIKFIAGGQYNNVGEGVSKFVPRLGTVVHFTPKFGFKALYAKAFRAPYTLEKKANFSIIVGKEDIRPEDVTTIDLQLFHQGDKHQISLTAYQTQQKDLITRKVLDKSSPLYPEHTGQFDNVNELLIRGVEFESKFTPIKSLYFPLSFTYQINEDGEGIENYSLTPNYMIKTGAGYTSDRFTTGIFYNYTSPYHSNKIHFPDVPIINPDEDDFHSLSANLTMNLKGFSKNPKFPALKVSLYGKNLLDDQFYVPYIDNRINTRPSVAGRSIYLKVSYEY